MLNIFKRKSVIEIEERAVKRQKLIDDKIRHSDEKDYQDALREQRNLHHLANISLEQDLQKQHVFDLQQAIDKKDNVIASLRLIINEKDSEIKDTQKAWAKILTVLPKILSLANILRVDAETVKLQAIGDYQKYVGYEDQVEALNRSMDRITPEVEKNLHLKK